MILSNRVSNELYQVAQIAILASCKATFHNLTVEKFNRSNYLFIDRDLHMEWTQWHDLVLCQEHLLKNQMSESSVL